MTDYVGLALTFRRFAEVECDRSPMYRTLACAIAEDQTLLDLAAEARSQPRTNLLLAAVHYLLLRGADHELRRFYPSLGGRFAEGDPIFPAFQDFCVKHREAIVQILHTRRVQTNEVARASILLPALGLIAARTNGHPLALIEVGTSAGLLLNVDRYGYDFGTGTVHGDPGSPVQLRCAVQGDQAPSVPASMPPVATKVGIDLFPIDVRDPVAASWLKALVWADQTDRFERLARAIDMAAAEPPAMIGGDAFDATPAALAKVTGAVAPVVFHCHTLNQFPPEARERFVAMLATHSTGRTLYHLALEYTGGKWPEMRLQTFSDGTLLSAERLARYQGHGDWIEWSLQALR